ncbi:MAG: ATPase [Acidobacteria bacterium]|nr:MAG: ATPase [Acidobacteriota bacterium]PYY21870.1 MAG: ATPase [Acidobacteriota bacterium]
MTAFGPLTILCIASYEKGHEFLREAKRQGAIVLLLTSESLMKTASWPSESIDEIFYMADVNKKWNPQHTILAVSHLARNRKIDRIVPLDDFDLETAAALREHMRIPGMGETTTRYFRDKLAMRSRAKFAKLPVPDFVRLLNDGEIHEFTRGVQSPWMLKPRSQAGAIGLKKIASEHELWKSLEALGDERSFYLLERYLPGQVYHVDTIVFHEKLLFCNVSRYGAPPMDVTHQGGVFTTRTLASDDSRTKELCELNWRVLQAFGLVRGVSHSEFIVARDGTTYFLETAARVGGANIAELIEAATGVNLWREWAKVELAGEEGSYAAPPTKRDAAGLLISLAKEEWPSTEEFKDPEIVWRMRKAWHVGMIVRSSHHERVEELLRQYSDRVQERYMAFQPPPDRPIH